MCDTALSFARDHLLPFIKKAASMIRGVPKEIEELKVELERIEDSINDADRRADDPEVDEKESRGMKARIKKLIEVYFHIEDVIDEYVIYEEQQLPDPGCAAAATNCVQTKILHFQIAHKIQDIKSRIKEIKETAEKDHGFPTPPSWGKASSSSTTNKNASIMHKLRDLDPLRTDESDVVGFEEPRNKLIDLLVEGRAERTVVSIVGMGGEGKTTLARKVFDNQQVVKHFDCRVWITVSQPYDIKKVLRDILDKFGVNPPQMNKDSLIDEVRNYLQGKRYVVVFDDVWEEDLWKDIDYAMIENKKGSKILITTRKKKVADACKISSFLEVLELAPLTKAKSLELFNKKAFHKWNGCCPENLKDISSKIVKKCKGLPLAIVVIGGLLSSKDENPVEWSRFIEIINAELGEDSMIKKILELSYHDLPSHLKSCFLYFGLYPEDFVVDSKTLTRQWIAEGFVKEDKKRTLEEVAEGYLKELIHRSLVQVDSISIDGRVKSCGVHDLVHAMIIEKCEDLSFGKNITEDKQFSLSGMIRRLSITTSFDNPIEGIESSHVRSLLVLKPQKSFESQAKRITSKKYRRIRELTYRHNKGIESSHVRSLHVLEPQTSLESFVKTIPTKYRRLKVLALRHIEDPNDWGSLNYLKYFEFRPIGLGYSELPKSIGMLVNLETLDLRYAVLENCEMPKEICKLRNLRHLLCHDMSLIQLKDGIGGMKSLQTLNSVYLDENEDENDNRVVELIQELGKLNQLRELVLIGVRNRYMSALSSSINEMQQLEKLYIEGVPSDAFIDLDLNSPPPRLQRVNLNGNLKKFPVWISKLQYLVKLKVSVKKEGNDAMKLLQSMPNLLSLTFVGTFEDEGERLQRLHFQDGWFKNLKELFLRGFDDLSDILIDEGALASLKKLTLFAIPELMRLPTGIQHLQKLEVLQLVFMSEELKQSIGPNDEGKEHWIFNQVPSVQLRYKR